MHRLHGRVGGQEGVAAEAAQCAAEGIRVDSGHSRRVVHEVRPLFGIDGNPAAWPSERGPRVGCQRLDSRFLAYRQALGLDDGLDFHSIRRSYVTHLIEDGWDPRFVQVGHEHASTTSIHTCVSSDFRTRTLRRHLDATVEAALSTQVVGQA